MTKTTDENLIQMLANARLTAALAGGHGKASNNERLAQDYVKELMLRGVDPPNDKVLFEIGVFNGKGSY